MGPLARLESVRPAGHGDAVAGVQPSFVARPVSTTEVSAVLRAAAESGAAVVPRGTGSKLHWGRAPDRCDLVLDMTGMDQVIEHAAGDLTATVQAGVTRDTLAEVLGKAGQRLALDPPGPPGTIGGVLAAGVAGPLRFRYGSGRDLLIGITIVRADGVVARSGGRVVKNVAGYDLGKLFAGSAGTLGVITEATFRVHPVPQAAAYVTAQTEATPGARDLIATALGPAFAPVAAEIDWPSGTAPISVAVALEGTAHAVAERARSLASALGRHTVVTDTPPLWWGAPADETGGTAVQVAFWPGALARVLDAIRALAGGLDPVVRGSAGAGVLDAAVPASASPERVAGFVTELRAALADGANGAPARATVVVRHAPAHVAALVDLLGPVLSLELMRSVKARFDPQGIMSPGRFP